MNRGTLLRYVPLLGHVVPTLVIGYGVVIPRSCIAGVNGLTIGFGASVVGTCLAYVLGQRAARARPKGADRAPSCSGPTSCARSPRPTACSGPGVAS